MTDSSRNQIGAHAAIAVAVIAGAQLLLVDPARQRASEAQAQTLSLQQTIAEAAASPTPVSANDKRTEKLRLMQSNLDRANAMTDPAQLVASIQVLGTRASVQVDRIDPDKTYPREEMRKGDPGAATAPTQAVKLTIDASGSYASVARFVRDIETRPGYVRTEKIDVRPSMRPGDDSVSVTIQTSQLAFDPKAFQLHAETDPSNQTGAGT